MPLGRKKNWFGKFGRRNHKQVLMKKNAEIQCLLLLHLQFQYGCKDSGKQCCWNLGLVSKSWGGDKCTLPLGCSNQNIFICKQEDHM
ncbi:unnamed protein product [Sphagnum troendelagicum]